MLWAAIVGVTLQFFLNMEIERYTLATGRDRRRRLRPLLETVWDLFCFLAVIPFVFPGWATSAVTIASFLGLWGEGAVPVVTIIVLLAMGISLTVSPVVYNTIEKAEFFKVGLTVVFLLVAIFAVLLPRPGTLADLGSVVTNFGSIKTSDTVTISVLLGGIVFAGAGGRSTSCRATTSATRASAWGITSRGSSHPLPERRWRSPRPAR